ncbi:MAG: Response regulator of zinc sigma-54-dependent two-component system [Candidatus Ozemobacter sibiricus]|uniref:Response regulator of zinc sigma-54-dependent two-component system n=1 Tax=Candidatus Ozemobacter sibiricus TaxID=2268124 RepID=A0A367ZSA6_9BACT|nr:MAG: Response regulator of zinc sigma-54-dependent two-component system [Candidatus Ozemobacter sibiricus]
MGHPIVLIDDEARLLRALKRALESDGHTVHDFLDPQEALRHIQAHPPALVVSDIRMEGLSGLDLLARLREKTPSVPCILMTAYSSVETAVAAVRLGARDYLLKPFEVSEFKAAVRRALEPAEAAGAPSGGEPRLIGRSPRMKSVLELIEAVAGTESTVLIQGESGTGKELVARLLHERSARANRPFVAVNCSAIPETLFESELFGHIKGSFTGALSDKPGLFQEAEGGTLFLDEIGDLAAASQAKLLRVLQDGSYKRVGDPRPAAANVRIIAATNRVLREEVAAGRFREDLWYRINVVEIDLPPLRERREDLPDLVAFLLERFGRKHRRGPFTVDEACLAHLRSHSWPGNVRELENVLERAVILKRSGALQPEDIPLPGGGKNPALASLPPGLLPLDQTMDQIEEELIRRALQTTGWNYSRAAELLGVTRQNLHYKLKKYHLRKEDHPA